MGVLDPLKRNAEQMQAEKEDYDGMIEMTIENLNSYAGAILNDRHDIMDDEDPFFFLMWRNEDVMNINTLEELEEEKKTAHMLKQELSLEGIRNRFSETFAKDKDVEPDYENPIESYQKLDSLHEKLENLNSNINDTVVNKTDMDLERMERNLTKLDYHALEVFYVGADDIKALPLIEGVVESQDNIEREKENLLAKSVDEHREHKESVDPEYDRVSLPDEPVNWEEVIEEDEIRDFMDVSDISTATYGDTLHMMMEQLCEDIEGVEPEYTLNFRNTGHERATDIENRVDNSLQPDALGDLFVYEFKHMPVDQKEHLEEHGTLEYNRKFAENVKQVNNYLNELDLPFGMLVNISSDMDVKEYVVERHPQRHTISDPEEYLSEFVHEKDEYEFESF